MSLAAAFRADLDLPLTAMEERRFANLLRERRARQAEALRLYEPMALQQAFHESRAYIRLFIGGNRFGKSIGSAMEFARAVTGRDPHDKYPARDGIWYVVGKSLKHLGDTIYRILFLPGAFRIIRDEYTGEWRTFRPWETADRIRESEALKSPPLIPERYITDVAWKHRNKMELDSIKFSTGWEAQFFSAEGNHPQGNKVDGVWFDEEIPPSPKDGPWFPEMSARLIDNKGVLMWSAAPQKGYDELYELYERGESQKAKYRLDPVKYPKPDIESFRGDQEDNIYIGTAEKLRFLQNLSPEEQLIRGRGEFTVSARLVYPEFSLATLGYPIEGRIPDNWTRFVFVDPGHTICAALFFACPPADACPEKEPMALAYDELYLPQANAAIFGKAMKDKQLMNPRFQAFVIDMHGARPTEAGSGMTVYEQYEAALRDNGVSSYETGHSFLAANDDIAAGITRVHDWMMLREKGETVRVHVPPRLRIATNDDKTVSRVPNFVYEMKRYPKQRVAGVVLDKPNDRGPTHLCQCCRYAAMHDPQFVEGKVKVGARANVYAFFNQLRQDQSRGYGQVAGLSFGPNRS